MNAHSVVLWLGPTHVESPRRAGDACARVIIHRDINLPHTHGPHQDIYCIALPWHLPIQGFPGGSMGGCQLHRRFWLCHGDVCHIHVQSGRIHLEQGYQAGVLHRRDIPQWNGRDSGSFPRRGCGGPSGCSSAKTADEEATEDSCHGSVLFGSSVSVPQSSKHPIRIGMLIHHIQSGCLAAIARLVSIIENRDIIDPTWQYASMGAWSGIELVVVYMGACLPLMRGFLGLVWPRRFGQAKQERHTAGPPAGPSGGSARPGLAHEMTQMEQTAVPPHPGRSEWDRESSDSTNRMVQTSRDYIAGSSR